jgi:hypothetical protein
MILKTKHYIEWDTVACQEDERLEVQLLQVSIEHSALCAEGGGWCAFFFAES